MVGYLKMKDKKINDVDNIGSPIDLSKRRLGKAGFLATAVVSSVSGKSAFAAVGTTNNCTVSGNLSGNLSRDPSQDPCEIKYSGHTPGFWKNRPREWVGTGLVPNYCDYTASGIHPACNKYDFDTTFNSDPLFAAEATVFTDVFGGLRYGSSTCTEVLWFFVKDKSSEHALGAHVVAAYLNAHYYYSSIAADSQFPYSKEDIVALYTDYLNGVLSEVLLKDVLVALNEMSGGTDPYWWDN